MQWKRDKLPGTDLSCWQACSGNISFLIVRETKGFFCSVKNFNRPEVKAIIFKGNVEFKDEEALAPENLAITNLTLAKEACEEKLKELLLK